MKLRLLLPAFALACVQTAFANETFTPLTQPREEALALSALPLQLRASANVYVLKNGRFKKPSNRQVASTAWWSATMPRQ